MLYDIAFLIFSLFYLPTLIFKGKMHADLGERFGRFRPEKLKELKACERAIWIQAVSVGEVAVCRPLIDALRTRFPDKRIVLSTITKTGNDLARKTYPSGVAIIYFPLDLSWIVRKVVSIIKPSLYIMVETEIWPNMIKEVSRLSIPCAMVNGRISDKSFGKYKAVKGLLKSALDGIGAFCMQSEIDASRIRAIGAAEDRVRVTGNMKFDVVSNIGTNKAVELMSMAGISGSGQLVVAGSTHGGEEVILIDVYKKLLPEFPGLKLLIAPRHIERAAEVRALVNDSGLAGKVIVLDKIGYLRDAYSMAAVVFVGGSLVPHGGQNPIEPAALGKPVIFGPHMFNFKEITAAFLENGAAFMVGSADALIDSMRFLLSDSERCKDVSIRAGEVIAEKRGATQRNLKEIERLLS